MYKIKNNKLISCVILFSSFNLLNAKTVFEKDTMLQSIIDKRAVSVSETFKNTIIKNDNFTFYKNLSNKEDSSFLIKKSKEKITSNVCLDIYQGVNSFKKNEIEGLSCLETFLLRGDSKAAFILSNIYYNKKKYDLSSVYYGVALGLGYNISDLRYDYKIKNTDNYKRFYYEGLRASTELEFIKTKIINKYNKYDYDVFKDQITDVQADKNPNIKELYKSLINNDFSNFINILASTNDNGDGLINLSKAKAGNIEGLVSYCSENLNGELKNFCLKKIFIYKGDQSAALKYTMNLFKINKILKNEKLDKELMFVLGLQEKSTITSSILSVVIKNKDVNSLTSLISSYNIGRLIKITEGL